MVYRTFLMQVSAHIQKSLGEGCRVQLIQVQKNNGLILDGLCIEGQNTSCSPTIYLNSYYLEYQKGIPLETICLFILEAYKSHTVAPAISDIDFSNFLSLKNQIVYRLINSASNQALLKEIPHVRFLDLAIVFCIYLSPDSPGKMTALIRNSHLKTWNISSEDLFSLAMVNTPRLLPPSIRSLTSVMEEILTGCSDDIPQPLVSSDSSEESSDREDLYETPLYVLTNQLGIYGASCLLYSRPLKNFADSRKTDIIILPSSIHEVLLISDRPDIDYEALSQMVMEINLSDVPLEDRLSNQVYRYSRETGKIALLSHAPETVETPNP